MAVGALLIACVAGPAALAQALTVVGDPGAEACYHAAVSADASPRGIESCNRAIESEKLVGRDLTATYVNRGIVHTARKELNRALDDYREARRLTPNLPEAQVGEGNVWFYAGDFSAALAAYDAALANGLRAPHAAQFNRGLTFERMGRWDDAASAYREAIRLSPDFAQAQEHLASLPAAKAAAEKAVAP